MKFLSFTCFFLLLLLLFFVVVVVVVLFLFCCCCFLFLFSPSYSSVPAVHLITTVYTTVVRTRECVCVREAGVRALTDSAVLPAGRVTSVVCM